MANTIPTSDQEIMKNKAAKTMETVAWMAGYYRENPHRFVSEYLGIKLKLFQKILLVLLMISTNFYYLASRGQGKLKLTSLYLKEMSNE